MTERMSPAEARALWASQPAKKPRRQKFNAKRTVVDGIAFDSKKEARRWQELRLMERAGDITHLERQKTFDLTVNGMKVARFVADFVYFWHGHRIVEDVKGYQNKGAPHTRVFEMKKRLMLALYNIQVRVV